MCAVGDNLRRIRDGLPAGVELVAVSKFHPVEALREAYEAGQRVFGESRVQELEAKIPLMPADVRWHFIGHLQTNKVKPLIGAVALIESVDSEKLLRLIDRLSAERGVVTRVLMQVHVAAETTKFGFLPDDLVAFFAAGGHRSLKATHICGIMGMATDTPDTNRVEADFAAIADTRRRILGAAPDLRGFDIVSMGMSGDYPLALRHGATHVRVGTAIFGDRV